MEMLFRSTLLLLTLLILHAGCGGGEQIAPVSGVVTFDGQPLANVEVVFAPLEKTGSINAGPASVGTTDAQGRFVLGLLSGKPGAVVGMHQVGITAPEISDEQMMAKLDVFIAQNPGLSPEEFSRLENRIRAEGKSGLSLPVSYNQQTVITFEVPAGESNRQILP